MTRPEIDGVFIPPGVSDSLARKLRGWPLNRVQSISISGPAGEYITPGTFATLGKFNRLQSTLNHFAFHGEGKPYDVDARIARQLTRAFPDLITLDLQNASFSIDAILEITNLPKLKELAFHQNRIPIEAVPFLKSLKARGAHIYLYGSSLPTAIQSKLDPHYNTPLKF